MRRSTEELLLRCFPAGTFAAAHFGSRDGKGATCNRIGACAIIDDQIPNVIDTSRCGVISVLFDHEGGYFWNRCNVEDLPPGVHRFESWEATCEFLFTALQLRRPAYNLPRQNGHVAVRPEYSFDNGTPPYSSKPRSPRVATVAVPGGVPLVAAASAVPRTMPTLTGYEHYQAAWEEQPNAVRRAPSCSIGQTAWEEQPNAVRRAPTCSIGQQPNVAPRPRSPREPTQHYNVDAQQRQMQLEPPERPRTMPQTMPILRPPDTWPPTRAEDQYAKPQQQQASAAQYETSQQQQASAGTYWDDPLIEMMRTNEREAQQATDLGPARRYQSLDGLGLMPPPVGCRQPEVYAAAVAAASADEEENSGCTMS